MDKCDKKDIRYMLTDKGISLNKVLYEIAIVTVDSGNYPDKLKKDLKTNLQERLL